MQILNLNGAWRFREAGTSAWKSAEVPGCNYLDLLRLKEIPDPFDGTNEKDVYWVALKDWEYQKEFDTSDALLSCDRVYLQCKTLDTICDVYLNDTCIGHGENAHLQYQFEIKSLLREKENVLRIVFHSPVKYVEQKQAVERCPRNNNGQDGIPHIRKPQCHFGWDWGPVLPPSGISGDISLVGYTTARFSDICILQNHRKNQVDLEVSAEIEPFSDNEALACKLTVVSPENAVLFEKTANIGEANDFSESVSIPNPQLWWTRDLSDRETQPLYTVKAELLANGTAVDSIQRTIGLRTLELNRERDRYGENFQFKINGVPIFAKGANWIPPDSFVNRYTNERMEYDLTAMKFANMNLLRVWGGGYYESDALYEKCDRDGILIWQDFCFACQPYPFFDEALLKNVQSEVEYNVKRLRHHASLALWNGNNEIETMSIAWRNRLKYVEWTEKFFYHILPEWMQNLDTQTPYIPGSPCGTAHLKGFDRDNVGDTHLWAVWHGLQPLTYYRKRMTRFCSEFGFESLPDLKTIETFAKPQDYSLTSEVFNAHQKCNSGNMKMAYYITSRFRLPKRFEDYIYLSQICQEECVRDATEHWRRNRGRCNGSIWWQLNDCWPVCSWASIDYYGNYKALQYAARHFNAPVTVSIEDTKDAVKIFCINDTQKSFPSCRVQYRLLHFDGKLLTSGHSEVLCLNPLESKCVLTLNVAELQKFGSLKTAVLVVELTDGEHTVLSRRTLLFDAEKNLHLPKTDVQMSVNIENGQAVYTLTADKFTRFLQLHSKSNTAPFSDNYFDLLPGETKTVTQQVEPSATEQELYADISFFSAGDVVPKGTPFTDFLTKMGVLLRPINLGSYIYDHKIPTDLKL